MRIKYYVQIFFLLITQVLAATSFNNSLSPRAEISVLTCGTGDELYSLYGHTAIRVSDPLQGIDRVYNYGMFDFQTDNFYGKFIKGNLLYFVDYDKYERFVGAYRYEDRSVYEQLLTLSPKQKEQIWEKLNFSLEKQNREYVYRFIDKNCTTKVLDIINDVLEEPVNVYIEENQISYRSILNVFQKNNYFVNLGINLVFGSKVDHQADKLFLPLNFMKGLEKTKIGGMPLVAKTTVLYEKEAEPVQVWWNTPWFFSILMLGLLLCMRNIWVRNVFFIVLGIMGLFFIAVGYYSFHEELTNNNTVFLCNPLFILIPFWSSEKYRAKLNLLISLLLMSLVLFVGLNFQSEKLMLSLPLVLVVLISLLMLKRAKNIKKLHMK